MKAIWVRVLRFRLIVLGYPHHRKFGCGVRGKVGIRVRVKVGASRVWVRVRLRLRVRDRVRVRVLECTVAMVLAYGARERFSQR